MMGFLREQWELELRKALPLLDGKLAILQRLNELLLLDKPCISGRKELLRLCSDLLCEQEELGSLFLLPQQEQMWIQEKMGPKWDALLSLCNVWHSHREEVKQLLGRLERAIWTLHDMGPAVNMDHIPAELMTRWRELVYTQFSADNRPLLQDVLSLLGHTELKIQHKQQIRKALSSMKVVVDTIAAVEDQMNKVLLSLKNGDAQNEKETIT